MRGSFGLHANLCLVYLQGGRSVANYVKNNSDKGFTTVRGADFDKEYYGMAVRKGDSALLAKLNAGIAKVKQDGTYDKLYEKYFGRKS
nr:transporter substrate-binding domain-containing protein [Microvirgula aerodenitrificans]